MKLPTENYKSENCVRERAEILFVANIDRVKRGPALHENSLKNVSACQTNYERVSPVLSKNMLLKIYRFHQESPLFIGDRVSTRDILYVV